MTTQCVSSQETVAAAPVVGWSAVADDIVSPHHHPSAAPHHTLATSAPGTSGSAELLSSDIMLRGLMDGLVTFRGSLLPGKLVKQS